MKCWFGGLFDMCARCALIYTAAGSVYITSIHKYTHKHSEAIKWLAHHSIDWLMWWLSRIHLWRSPWLAVDWSKYLNTNCGWSGVFTTYMLLKSKQSVDRYAQFIRQRVSWSQRSNHNVNSLTDTPKRIIANCDMWHWPYFVVVALNNPFFPVIKTHRHALSDKDVFCPTAIDLLRETQQNIEKLINNSHTDRWLISVRQLLFQWISTTKSMTVALLSHNNSFAAATAVNALFRLIHSINCSAFHIVSVCCWILFIRFHKSAVAINETKTHKYQWIIVHLSPFVSSSNQCDVSVSLCAHNRSVCWSFRAHAQHTSNDVTSFFWIFFHLFCGSSNLRTNHSLLLYCAKEKTEKSRKRIPRRSSDFSFQRSRTEKIE